MANLRVRFVGWVRSEVLVFVLTCGGEDFARNDRERIPAAVNVPRMK